MREGEYEDRVVRKGDKEMVSKIGSKVWRNLLFREWGEKKKSEVRGKERREKKEREERNELLGYTEDSSH